MSGYDVWRLKPEHATDSHVQIWKRECPSTLIERSFLLRSAEIYVWKIQSLLSFQTVAPPEIKACLGTVGRLKGANICALFR